MQGVQDPKKVENECRRRQFAGVDHLPDVAND